MRYSQSKIVTFLLTIKYLTATKGGLRASPVTQTVKNMPVMQETRVRFLSPEDPLGKGMATHSSTLAWEIPWTEEPGELQFVESQRHN